MTAAPETSLGHGLEQLAQRLRRGEAHVAGVLSGTSADGIDVALVRPRPGSSPELVEFETRPFPADLAHRVHAVLGGGHAGLREAAILHRDLGRAFGLAVEAVARESGVSLDLVGSHGQTLWHHDGVGTSGPATLQLGDGDHVARACGAFTVSDFRQADIAAGGEGAPLTALVDADLYPQVARPFAVLNLGGIANVGWIPEDPGELVSFDTGPAGALLDGLARRLLDQPFDAAGASAARGRVSEPLVRAFLDHPYLELAPPKSTGRDTFGSAWIDSVLERDEAVGLAGPDVLASAAAAVARHVAAGLGALPGRPSRVVVAGGGLHHAGLRAALESHCEVPVVPSDAEGLPADAREAVAFALLAVRFVEHTPLTRPGATGAAPGALLGKLSVPPGSGPSRSQGSRPG